MTVRIRLRFAASAKSLLRRSRYVFFALGILLLGYVGYALVDSSVYQAYQTWRFEQALSAPTPLAPNIVSSSRGSAENLLRAARAGSPLGRIEIGSIGLAVMLLEGTDDRTLRRAVGHIPGTSLPGQQGNVAIAGHRDTFFRGLRNVRKGDEIELTTLNGFYRYRVDFTKVVEPGDVEVLSDSDDPTLTLVTCYPFQFVGSAPKRFIVRAHRSIE